MNELTLVIFLRYTVAPMTRTLTAIGIPGVDCDAHLASGDAGPSLVPRTNRRFQC
jgi:hypothetical protein